MRTYDMGKEAYNALAKFRGNQPATISAWMQGPQQVFTKYLQE
jgi:hypothetical protein